MSALSAFFVRHRRRVFFVLLVGVALGAWSDLSARFPREMEVEFALGNDHQQVAELRVAYLRGNEEFAGASFAFPTGAPERVRHRVKLPAGKFELRCELRTQNGASRLIQRPLQSPAEGVVRVALANDSSAHASAAHRK